MGRFRPLKASIKEISLLNTEDSYPFDPALHHAPHSDLHPGAGSRAIELRNIS